MPNVIRNAIGFAAPALVSIACCGSHSAPVAVPAASSALPTEPPIVPAAKSQSSLSPLTRSSIANIVVSNPTGDDRLSETVAVHSSDLHKFWAEPSQLVLVNADGQRVLSQLVDTNGDESPDELVFQVDLRTGQTKTFRLTFGERQTPTRDQFRVYGRFVRERHDDFAWENDLVAYRMYGPALESYDREPLVSSGIDIWAKRTHRLIVNDWYMRGDYHRDHGEGADFYSVGKSRGCGGLGVWSNDKLYVSRNFTASRVLANGPVRLVFELTYAPFDVGNTKVSETKRVTLDAGSHFGKYESTFTCNGEQPRLSVGIGIAKHKGSTLQTAPDNSWMHAWEPISGTDGNLGCAVVLPSGTPATRQETSSDYLTVVDKPSGRSLTYYAGSGWDHSTHLSNQAGFTGKVAEQARRIAKPITVELAQGAGAEPWSSRACSTAFKSMPDALAGRWTYDGGFVLLGCEQAARKYSNPQLAEFVKRAVDGLIGPDGVIQGYRAEEYNIDNLNMGKVLFSLLGSANSPSEQQKYQAALHSLRLQMKTHPRTKEGGFWHKQIYPNQMWLDGAYMAGPFLAKYAVTFNEPDLLNDVVRQFELLERHTRDAKTGLLYHGWDESREQRWANPKTGTSPSFWGRAVGWYAMALVDTLEVMPLAHPKRALLISILNRLATALVAMQEPETGVWWQVLDRAKQEKNYREASASAMFVYALSKGVRLGWLEPRKYEEPAMRGYRGLLERFVEVNTDGALALKNVCKVAGLGGTPYRDGTYDYYTSTDVVTNDPKGLGAFIVASLERE